MGFSKLLVCEHIFVCTHMGMQEIVCDHVQKCVCMYAKFFLFSHIFDCRRTCSCGKIVCYVRAGVAKNPCTITVWDLASSPRNKFRDLIFAILFSPPSLYYYYLAVPVGWPVYRMHIWYCCHSQNY